MAERAIVIDPGDDVAVAVADLAAGEICAVRVSEDTRTVQLREPIPFGHKFALRRIPKGDLVLKYGEPIGRATAEIELGAWVHTHNLVSDRAKERVREEIRS